MRKTPRMNYLLCLAPRAGICGAWVTVMDTRKVERSVLQFLNHKLGLAYGCIIKSLITKNLSF